MSTKPNPVLVMEDSPEQFIGEIMLGGRLRKVAVNANAIINAEELMGASISIFAQGGARTSHMRAIVFAALQEATRITSAAKKPDPKLTLEVVGSWLTTAKMSQAVTDIMALLRKFRGDDSAMLAPYVPTPTEVLEKLFELVDVLGFEVVDLGCGQGNMLQDAAKMGAIKVVGYELDLERFWITKGKLLALKYEEKLPVDVAVHSAPLTDADVSTADLVFIYLLQDSNQKIKQWLGANMKKGALLVSHDFTMEEWTPRDQVEVTTANNIKHRLTTYVIGPDTPVENVE